MILKRRDLLKLPLAASGLLATGAQAQPTCATDGTPAQFIPKKAADPQAADKDLEKFPKCPYCGMDRRQFHHSRMLLQYSDDLPDGVCSLHCAAISLAVNVDREPKTIWVADNASSAEIKPLLVVDQATFLVGSRIRAVMSRRSKVAYGSEAAARAAMAENGGELANFDQALLAAYTDMSQDVAMIRKSREERRQRAAGRAHG
jgi:nitrous oxide reductase accessory protein NosL